MAENTDIFDGTVSVTAGTKVVTGVGTLWLSAGIQSGDMFGSDGYSRARIDTVNSNTSITLKDNWRGPTLAAGSPYWIRYQGDNSRYSALLGQVRKMLSQPSVSALAALVGATNKLPFYTGPDTMDLTDLTAKGREIIGAANSAAAYGVLGPIPDAQLPAGINRINPDTPAADCNLILENGTFLVSGASLNVPIPNAGFVVMMRQTSTFGRQIYYMRDQMRMFSRNWTAGVFGAWAEIAGGSLAANGWFRLPNGIIVQWANQVATSQASTLVTYNLPTAFPNAGFVAVGQNAEWATTGARGIGYTLYSLSTTQVTFATNVTPAQPLRTNYIAIGW